MRKRKNIIFFLSHEVFSYTLKIADGGYEIAMVLDFIWEIEKGDVSFIYQMSAFTVQCEWHPLCNLKYVKYQPEVCGVHEVYQNLFGVDVS